MWAGWTLLVARGLDPDAATHYALAYAQAHGFSTHDREEYDAQRAFSSGYDRALGKRCRAYGILTSTAAEQTAGTQDSRRHNRLLRAHREDQPAFRERSVVARAAADEAQERPEFSRGFAQAQLFHANRRGKL